VSTTTLLLDNYDSFTFNLFQYLAETNGTDPIVVRNDGATWDDLAGLEFDNIVISPGPGRPDNPADFGVCRTAIESADVPVLGVCLGHQGLACFAGASVVHAPEVMHGRLSRVFHDESALFAGIPQGFEAVRYHSLCVDTALPSWLEPIAWTADGVLMGVAHGARPQWGVQFHPESICTEHGRRLLANFRDLTPPRRRRRRHRDACVVPRGARNEWNGGGPARPALTVERLDRLYDPERVFVQLFGDDPHAFWLDSSKAGDPRARFSFVGASDTFVSYDVARRTVTVDRHGAVEEHHETIFDYLRRELRRLRRTDDELPFDLNGGFVGYFGYELKADCGGDAAHPSPLPDAAFVFADRLIAFDHREQTTYVVALGSTPEEQRWVGETCQAMTVERPIADPVAADPPHHVEFRLSRSYETYIDDIERIKDHLREGETYEVCLTNRITTDPVPDPLRLYRTLRRVNPAPFSAYLRFGDLAVLSSSPERFLSVGRDRWVEAKPIKGTTRRGHDPVEDRELSDELRTSEKNRAENLMITDLLRNDLGLVCEVGSVHVPHLMEIETYETVHQLVSTIRGRLREDLAAPDCVQACFPGGSTTGAPKKRTLQIIDELEHEARGVYSGAIGYLGLSGAADLNIVIRTIVTDGHSATIGAGGAIVMQSDPDDEYQEMLLKAEALMRAIARDAGAEVTPVLDPVEPATGQPGVVAHA
jgi:para-aminobenzoate synthetase